MDLSSVHNLSPYCKSCKTHVTLASTLTAMLCMFTKDDRWMFQLNKGSGQSDNNLTIVYQVIVLGASVGSLRYSSGVSRVYFVNLYSFTPLPL